MASTPETQYALSGGNHIAYQVADGAERDILYVPRTTTPIDLLWDDPIVARGLRRLTACGRLIMCDLRGWGASDSIETTRLPAMQAWMDDIGAVLDAAESDQATLVAGSESALPLMLFAATNPDRTTGLVLINAFACFLRTPETPFGIPSESAERYVELYRSISGRGALVDYLAPTRSSEPAFRRWSTRCQRLGAGPGSAAPILFTDIVGSTERAATLGDAAWKLVREAHDELLRSHIEGFGGQLIETTGDGALATFNGPARAIYCACGIRDAAESLGLSIRAGLHTGEIELMNGGIGGLAVHIGARVAALAAAAEVLVSASVPPLVAGSAVRFTPRGVHQLKGVPDQWAVYSVNEGA